MSMTSSIKRAKAAQSAMGTVNPDASPRARRPTLHLLRVADIDHITDDAVAITFDVPPALRDEFSYEPGQHIAVRATVAGDDVRRNYSICAPVQSGILRIGVKRLPDGVFSNYALERLQVGDSLEVLSPTGSFTTELNQDHALHYGAVAAGSGITPILSIFSSMLAAEPNSTATLIFVNVNTQSIMFLEDLEDLKNQYMDRFRLFHVLDGETQEAEILSGRLDGARLRALLDGIGVGDVDKWFLCGPLPLTDVIREALLERNVKNENIHRELFHTSAVPPKPRAKTSITSELGSAIEIHLDGRATSFKLQPGTQSILEATQGYRGEVPYACKNGVCGTCRAKLVDGKVDMVQNFALEPDEVENGYVLTCQSFPLSENVVLDFDQ